MHEYALLINLSVSLAVALVLGLITQRAGLSPIVGYLLTGIILGPQTPGFVADATMAAQFAEIGVVLLMFGVGLHFHLDDLVKVWRIAVPGAFGQILAATLMAMLAAVLLGWPLASGLIVGLAVSVASTVVLVRMLTDNDVLHTSTGHIALGWLIVEDIFTVLVLVALPAIGGIAGQAEADGEGLVLPLALAVAKIAGLAVVVLVFGKRVIPWFLRLVARTRSRELFTLAVLALAVLALALAIATGSAVVFGVSMALGAFLAGMVVGQTEVSHQAAADALPMRDAFAVLFFVSVGMLFDPHVLQSEIMLLLALLAVVLIGKPLIAFAIVWAMRYSPRTALTVAVALAQVGEFSFLLGSEAMHDGLFTADGQSLLVACALISITVNPLLFRGLAPFERWLRGRERIWRAVSRRSESGAAAINVAARDRLLSEEAAEQALPRAIVVGYGPVGNSAASILRGVDCEPVIVDLNVDSIRALTAAGKLAIYGDATRRDVLEAAGIHRACYLLVTIPDLISRTLIILTAKELNPGIRVFTRAHYLQERSWLKEIGATEIAIEEAETALGLALLVLRAVGADEARVKSEIARIRGELEPDRNEPIAADEAPGLQDRVR